MIPVLPEVGPGARVGHYEILSEVGRGGMGVVFRARDTALRRLAALKSPLSGQVEHQRRFLGEARAAARVSHPNIVPIFEVFEESGRPWLAMEFVEGGTLSTLVRDMALPVSEVLRLAQGLGEALQCAHSHHLLHRDITPRNILVSNSGEARLTDFGLAHSFRREVDCSDSTASGVFALAPPAGGTPGYMSPEQILGGPQDVRSDLFSLGVVIYEMCAGARAFSGPDPAAVADAIISKQPASLQRLNPNVPTELARIVGKALAKAADERYQSAQEIVADIKALRRQIDSGATIEEYEAPRSRRLWRGLTIGLAAVVAVGVGGLALRQWLASPLPPSTPRQVTSAPGWEAEPALSPDGGLIAYASDESGQSDVWLVDAHGGSTLRLTDDAAVDRSPAWFPDGSAVAFVSRRGGRDGVWRVPRLGGSATALVADAKDPALSLDGRRIAFVRSTPTGDRIFVSSLGEPESARRLTGDKDGLWNHARPAWAPDGNSLCYSAQRDLWTVSTAGGPARRLTVDDEVDAECVWSPSGRYVYFSSYREGTLAIWRVSAGGGKPERVTLGGGPEVHPSLSRDGRLLAYSTLLQNADVVVREVATAKEHAKEQRFGGLREDFSPVFCPDPRSIVFNSNRLGGRYDLWLQPIGSDVAAAPRRLTDHPGSVSHPSCSPDGRWVAYHRVLGGQRDIWVAPLAGGLAERFTNDPAADFHPDWSPDGSRLAFASSEREGGSHIFVEPVVAGRRGGPARRLTEGDGDDEAPAWSPDGRAIAFVRSTADEGGDVWTVPADGSGPARRVTTAARAARARWERPSGLLVVRGQWGAAGYSLRRIRADTGADAGTLLTLGADHDFPDFDVSSDGRWLAFSRADRRGDLWLLQAQEGSY